MQQRHDLIPIHDALETLRFRIEKGQERLVQQHQWQRGQDARITAVSKFFVVIAGTELSIMLATRMLTDEWWRREAQTEQPPADKNGVVIQFQEFAKVSFLTLVNASIESSCRNLLRALAPGVGKNATAQWATIYSALLTRVTTRVSMTDATSLLDLLRNLRNTIHHNGVFFSNSETDLTVVHRGRSFQFRHAQAATFANWTLLLEVANEAFDLLLAVLESPEIVGLPGPVASEFL